MIRLNKVLMCAVLGAIFIGGIACSKEKSPEDYVNVFIGTAYNGHTFAGAAAPFGMIQASADTGNFNWRYCSGYNYDDAKIMRFSQTHLNGTGVGDLGDAAIMPFDENSKTKNYSSSFKKASESAKLGYYKVYLDDAASQVEITATERYAHYKIRFDGNAPRLLVDLQYGITSSEKATNYNSVSGSFNKQSPDTITAHRASKSWVSRDMYFAMHFSKNIKNIKEIAPVGNEKLPHFELEFDFPKNKEKVVEVKIAVSGVSEKNALETLTKTALQNDFEATYKQNRKAWNKIFSKVQIKGSDSQKENFYTALYHAFIQPNNIADLNGEYVGADGKVAKAEGGEYYSTFSLWDTFRSANSLYCLLTPDKASTFADSMLRHFDAAKRLPIWTLWGKENYCMIGNHSIPFLAECATKGIKIDEEKALNACVATSNFENMQDYIKYGYFPFDKVRHAPVAKTLEHSYDDYCVMLLAKKLGKSDIAQTFAKRSKNYENLFDKRVNFMRGKDSNGNWREPFDEFKYPNAGGCGRDYVEGNALQYSWHVLQDPENLIALHGGNEKFVEHLTQLFNMPEKKEGAGFAADATGLIGQYAHGNEPSHHVVYLFALANRSDKTAELVREIFDRFYLNKPDGLCGNDDCGQMSGWYIFSALGFYPLSPADAEYVLGAPQIPYAKITLQNGKTFEIVAKNLSKENKYVKCITLNGSPISKKIKHSDILNGGTLIFEMQ